MINYFSVKPLQDIVTALATLALVPGPALQAAQRIPTASQTTAGLQRSHVVYDAYILGSGDSLQVELLNITQLSGTFAIGPDGTMYLPWLRALYVEGLTVEELR